MVVEVVSILPATWTRLFRRCILAPAHYDTKASSAVIAQERTDGTRGIPTVSTPIERSPGLIPLSDPAPTPDPRLSPRLGEGYASDHLNT
jgi:hypothetical protein